MAFSDLRPVHFALFSGIRTLFPTKVIFRAARKIMGRRGRVATAHAVDSVPEVQAERPGHNCRGQYSRSPSQAAWPQSTSHKDVPTGLWLRCCAPQAVWPRHMPWTVFQKSRPSGLATIVAGPSGPVLLSEGRRPAVRCCSRSPGRRPCWWRATLRRGRAAAADFNKE